MIKNKLIAIKLEDSNINNKIEKLAELVNKLEKSTDKNRFDLIVNILNHLYALIGSIKVGVPNRTQLQVIQNFITKLTDPKYKIRPYLPDAIKKLGFAILDKPHNEMNISDLEFIKKLLTNLEIIYLSLDIGSIQKKETYSSLNSLKMLLKALNINKIIEINKAIAELEEEIDAYDIILNAKGDAIQGFDSYNLVDSLFNLISLIKTNVPVMSQLEKIKTLINGLTDPKYKLLTPFLAKPLYKIAVIVINKPGYETINRNIDFVKGIINNLDEISKSPNLENDKNILVNKYKISLLKQYLEKNTSIL